MTAKYLNIEQWNRKEHFHFFSTMDQPFFGLVAEVECGGAMQNCKRNGATFFIYLALGVWLLQSVKLLTNQHLPERLGAMFAVFLGLWMIKDFFLPGWGWQLHGPAWMVAVTRRTAQRATVPALVGGGILIGLCTVPCSGAVYLGIISLLALQPSALLGYAYLVLYNVIFILPLIVILVAASARPTLNHLAHWNLHHKEWVRLILGSGVVVMGLLILAAV